MHIRYGRGAYNYQKIRKERGSGSMRKDFGFHKTLPRRVWNYLKRPGQSRVKIATVGALIVWQIANATGFLLEALMVSTGKTGERSQPTS